MKYNKILMGVELQAHRRNYVYYSQIQIYFYQYNSRFCDDCLTYINSISDKAQTRHDAIEYLKMILEINKIANNEYAVALCNTAIFNLYTCSDKDYEATRDECWKGVGEEEPPNPEIGKLKKELAELDNKLSALYNE